VRARHWQLRHLAGWLIAGSVLTGVFAIAVRAGWGGLAARVLEGGTLFLAAAAYLAHVFAHHEHARRFGSQRCCDRAVRDRPGDHREPVDLSGGRENERHA
jgi:hypothetical protein